MKFVTKRKIDELGRIVLPIEFRRFFNLSAGDSVEMKATKYDIIISKATAEQENVKTIDELGRIHIPSELRKKFNFEAKALIAMLPFEDGIHLSLTDEPIETLESTKKTTPDNVEVFERDYTANKRRYRSLVKETWEDGSLFSRMVKAGVFEEYNRKNMEIPRIIDPAVKEAYENALKYCDKWALLRGGKVRGEIDYNEFIAYIRVTFNFIEFFSDSMTLMQYIAQTADYVLFEPNTYGEITMVIRYRYFMKIENSGEFLLEALHNHPELTEELLAERQKEVDAILNDPKLSKHIKEAADRVGVTPEEYLDRLDDVMNEEPAQFIEMLQAYMNKSENGEIKEEYQDTEN